MKFFNTGDIALHWNPKRGQYRFRMMWYSLDTIRCWYYYVSPVISREFHDRPIRTTLLSLLILVTLGVFYLILVYPLMAISTGNITFH